jgi:hypothetical protein
MLRLLSPLAPQKCEKVKSFHIGVCRIFLFLRFFCKNVVKCSSGTILLDTEATLKLLIFDFLAVGVSQRFEYLELVSHHI